MRSSEIQLTVEFGNTDRAGIVYYPNYFAWFDKATQWFFRNMNLPLKQLQNKSNIILPLLEAHCSFEKSLTDDDLITIKTTIVEVNRKTLKFQHEILKDGIRTSVGYEIRGWVKKEGSDIAATIIPDDIRELLTKEKVAK